MWDIGENNLSYPVVFSHFSRLNGQVTKLLYIRFRFRFRVYSPNHNIYYTYKNIDWWADQK